MMLPFVDRVPTAEEIERFRLILSTYQDGTGMLKAKDDTLPGWRDFERSVAAAFGGMALETKGIYKVSICHCNGTEPQAITNCSSTLLIYLTLKH
jgi:hypothetical protein